MSLILGIKGIIAVMVTPFREDKELDEEGLRKLVNFLIENGVHGLFPVGTTGEFFSLSEEEKKRVIAIVVEEAKKRVPVYAGTGGISTKEVVELTKYAEDVGADAATIITPFFLKPSLKELHYHYKTIAEAVNIPIVLYNNPPRTGGVNLTPELVCKLSEIKNIIGIKESSGNTTQIAEYIRRCGERMAVLSGRDTLIFSTLMHGGTGAVSGCANMVPKIVVGIYESFIKGEVTKARELQYKLAPLRSTFGLGTYPAVVKECMNMMGLPAGPCRGPILPLSKNKRQKLRELLLDLGAIKTYQNLKSKEG